MDHKKKYHQALLNNKGQLNEIDLGEKLGLNEYETREIISQLLSEHKIEYAENRFCNYRIYKKTKRKNFSN